MSETVCIHGIPVDPWYIRCDKCERETPSERTEMTTSDIMRARNQARGTEMFVAFEARQAARLAEQDGIPIADAVMLRLNEALGEDPPAETIQAVLTQLGEPLDDPERAGVPTFWSKTLGHRVTIPTDDPDYGYGGAFDGFTVSSDADPGL